MLNETGGMEIVGIIWPAIVYLTMTAIFMPVYLLLVVSLVKDRLKSNRFNSTFYNLLLSLAIGDILAMVFFASTDVFKDMGFFSSFFWDNRDHYWTAPLGYNNVYFFLFVRCFGAALISLQRYITVCRSHSRVNQLMSQMKFWQIVLVHWLPPTLYSLPIILNWNIHYDTVDTLKLMVTAFNLKYAMFAGDAFCFACFTICIVAYFSVLKQFKSSKMTRNLKKELRITIQVAGPVLAITCAFIFYLFQLIFAVNNQSDLTFFMRSVYPVVTGFMSYVNPLVYLIFSDDLRKLLISTLLCRKFEPENTSGVRIRVQPSSAFSTTEIRQ